jgi:hypothetical protein
MRHSLYLLALVSAAGAACGSDATPPGLTDDGGSVARADAAPPPPEADAAPGRPQFQRCTGLPFTPEPAGSWTHTGSAVTAALGSPGHSAQDVFAVDGTAGTLEGYFVYGAFSAAISGEPVEVYLDECDGSWTRLGEAVTDSAGHVTFAVPETLPIGQYEARFQVVGDASTTTSSLWVLPVGTHLAVTDIDGTMTSSDFELFQQILNGSYVPMAYPSAVELTKAHDTLGHVVVYLTGRPAGLTLKTREWLANLGFAVGPLHVTDSTGQILPTEAGVGTFKKDFLQGLLDKGFLVDVAYGNATTDVFAYLGVSLPAEDVWIIGSNGGLMGTHAVVDSWAERTAEVTALPEVVPPFDW